MLKQCIAPGWILVTHHGVCSSSSCHMGSAYNTPDCTLEGVIILQLYIIWNKSYRSFDAAGLVSRIKSFLQDDIKAQKMMNLYQITADMDRNKTFYKMQKFTADGLFLAVHWAALRANPEI